MMNSSWINLERNPSFGSTLNAGGEENYEVSMRRDVKNNNSSKVARLALNYPGSAYMADFD
jgi:hypothetical protein